MYFSQALRMLYIEKSRLQALIKALNNHRNSDMQLFEKSRKESETQKIK